MLYKRFFSPPEQSYFLFGPRGVGKSTLMNMLYQDEAVWIDLLHPEQLRNYTSRPERLYELIDAEKSKKIIIIDEIQKVPGILTVIHSLIEQKRGLQFILTGSSARKIKRTGADLLGGRAFKCVLHPFMAAEMADHFNLQKALEEGMLPLLSASHDPKHALASYVSLYLQEEIQAEGLVRNLEHFSRFLEIITFSHGNILNITNISRECSVKRKTVENYITILEELLLAFQLPIFTKRAQRELSAHPKFYLFDPGVYRTLRPKGILDKPEEAEGAALEGLVAQHLLAWNDYSFEKHEIGFWRTRSGVEVDFVIYGPTHFFAIEVKNARHISPLDLKPLEAFIQDYPMAKPFLLYRGKERLKQKGIMILPCDEFLAQLVPNKPLI